jgi:hypothetical protein
LRDISFYAISLRVRRAQTVSIGGKMANKFKVVKDMSYPGGYTIVTTGKGYKPQVGRGGEAVGITELRGNKPPVLNLGRCGKLVLPASRQAAQKLCDKINRRFPGVQS